MVGIAVKDAFPICNPDNKTITPTSLDDGAQVKQSRIKNMSDVASAVEVSSACSASSVDTNEALLEMLGINDDGFGFSIDSPAIAEDSILISLEKIRRASKARPESIDLPARCSRYLHPPSSCCAFVLPSVLSPAECRYIVHKATKTTTGFHYVTEAQHTDDGGGKTSVRLQNPNPHKLSVYEDVAFLEKLWEKMRQHIGVKNGLLDEFCRRTCCGPPLGLNPRVRVLKYDALDDDRFEPHFDATTRVGDQTSLLTVLVYLNDGDGADFDGGETIYLDLDVSNVNIVKTPGYGSNSKEIGCARVTPKTGSVVIFEHDLYHSGAPLTRGTKYVMRTDIMFDATKVGVDAGDGCRRRQNDAGEIGEFELVGVGDDETIATPKAIVDLVESAGLSAPEKKYLNEMGVLHITPEAFLAPGVAVMRMLLADGLRDEKSHALVKLATDLVRKNR